MISLETFINDTKGKIIALPNGKQKGQCVSLVQQYLLECYDIPVKTRGNAIDFGDSLVKEGYARKVDKAEYGDLIVFETGEYGHIGIYIDKNKMYDQNNGTHDSYKAGYSMIFNVYKRYYRIIKKEEWTAGDYELLFSKAVRKTPNCDNDKNIQIVGLLKAFKPYCVEKGYFQKAHLKAGTEVLIDSIYLDKERRVWGKSDKYYICLCNKKGEAQARRVN